MQRCILSRSAYETTRYYCESEGTFSVTQSNAGARQLHGRLGGVHATGVLHGRRMHAMQAALAMGHGECARIMREEYSRFVREEMARAREEAEAEARGWG